MHVWLQCFALPIFVCRVDFLLPLASSLSPSWRCRVELLLKVPRNAGVGAEPHAIPPHVSRQQDLVLTSARNHRAYLANVMIPRI